MQNTCNRIIDGVAGVRQQVNNDNGNREKRAKKRNDARGIVLANWFVLAFLKFVAHVRDRCSHWSHFVYDNQPHLIIRWIASNNLSRYEATQHTRILIPLFNLVKHIKDGHWPGGLANIFAGWRWSNINWCIILHAVKFEVITMWKCPVCARIRVIIW